MLKWIYLSAQPESKRLNFLSDFLKQNGVDNEFKRVEVNDSNFIEAITEATKTQDQILFDIKFINKISKAFTKLSAKHYFSPTSDALFKDASGWLPRSFMEEVFIKTLNINSMVFDIQANALVIGSGTLARIVLNGFLKVGYTKFLICDLDQSAAEAFFKDFQSRNFNLDLKFVSQEDLAYLPGSSSLVVNTMPFEGSDDFMADLYYFNYLNKNGIVMDFNLLPLDSPLVKQARDLGIRCLEAYKFYCLRDFAWLEAVSNQKLPWEAFQQAWLAALDEGKA